ncbi:biotin--[acetyl-CoA-carboxylase] ligase [Rhodobacteraceae bacterium NNCM2]|nr:biotin--[acetyl-CoA-carboxylase] ligase [Coraliihabitans acroporae]
MTGWPAGIERRVLDQTDSTNAEAARLAATGHRAPVWIMALRQQAGRGRHGRAWSMPVGNLAATLLDFPGGGIAEAGLRSFTASLAVADLLGQIAPSAKVSLKWPNDVLLNGGKVAGILLESASDGARLDWLVTGIGINLAAAPDAASIAAGTAPPTSVAGEGGRALPPEEALTLLAAALDHWDSRIRTEGFAPIRAAWLARAARLGERIEARLPARSVTGIFEDVDAAGALVLRTPTGPERIAAADVYFPE